MIARTKYLFLVALPLLIFFVGCSQSGSKSTNTTYGFSISKDSLFVNSSRSGSHTLSYSIMGKPFKSKDFYNNLAVELKELVVADESLINEYAYYIAQNGSIPIRLSIGSQIDTTVRLIINTESLVDDSKSMIISGPCLRISSKHTSVTQERDIKKWLFNNGTHADDIFIHRMAEILNILTASSANELVPEDGQEIPVLKDFQNVTYKISTDIKADYYYLFASNTYQDINDFIADVVSQDFINAAKSTSNGIHCLRRKDNGGLLVISLIAINKDWSKKIIPLGLVIIDNSIPHISGDARIPGIKINEDYVNKLNKSLYFPELNVQVLYPDQIPPYSGWVDITTEQFRGDDAKFTVSFGGDVESITITREVHSSYYWHGPGTKTITLDGKTSPIHFSYTLDLGIGDNYIPIKVKDKRGNVSEFSYHIKMVQVEKTNPEINIDNNIDIWN